MNKKSPPLPDYLRFWMERNVGRSPIWDFPELADSATLSYQRLHFDNYLTVLDLFKNDPSPFVEMDFKEENALYEYVANLWICAPYSYKKGGIDWLIRKRGGEGVGLLHAYDFSKEQVDNRHRSCTIGFLIAAPFRGSGVAKEAVLHLQQYLFQQMDMLYLTAYTKQDNERSIRFLEKMGYVETTLKYAGSDKRYYQKVNEEVKKSDHYSATAL